MSSDSTDSGRFTRRVEDFVCEHCGKTVVGNGYTNHCPHCLWSKHVDVFPGDRAETCRGSMKPVGVEPKRDAYVITFRCTKCGKEGRNRSAPEDSFEEMLAVMQRVGDRYR